jgi:hypothetical protein
VNYGIGECRRPEQTKTRYPGLLDIAADCGQFHHAATLCMAQTLLSVFHNAVNLDAALENGQYD